MPRGIKNILSYLLSIAICVSLSAASAATLSANPALCAGLLTSDFSHATVEIESLITRILGESPQREPLRPSEDLFKLPLAKLERLLGSKNVRALLRQDPFLHAYHEQIAVRIQSVTLKGSGGNYPYNATLECLKAITVFLRIINNNYTSEEIHPLRTSLIDDSPLVKSLLNNPKQFYTRLQKRIKHQGQNALFPELAPSVAKLMVDLESAETKKLCDLSIYLCKLRQHHINELNRVLELGLPYLKTINIIQNAVAFFDVVERGRPGAYVPSLYHSIRWQYHFNLMLAEIPDHILFPTQYALGVSDLMKGRGVPLGLVGITTKPLYADGFFQSPLEFWFHDINHARRAWQQFVDRAKTLNLKLENYSNLSEQFIRQEIFPAVEIKNTDTIELKNLKRISKVILFEIGHEEALPFDRELLAWALARQPFSPGLFVFESQSDQKVNYSLGPMASVLSVVFRKLEGDFYDMSEMRISGLGDQSVRTRAMVAKAYEQEQWLPKRQYG